MKTIFISIPITGRDMKLVKDESDRANKLAHDMGFRPINPTVIVPSSISNDPEDYDSWKYAMSICFNELIKCDRVLIVDVPDRQNSKGCKIEEFIAKTLKFDMYYTDQNITSIAKNIPGKWANDKTHTSAILDKLLK